MERRKRKATNDIPSGAPENKNSYRERNTGSRKNSKNQQVPDPKYDEESNIILAKLDKKKGYIDGKEKILVSLDDSFSPARVVLLINSNEYVISSAGILTSK